MPGRIFSCLVLEWVEPEKKSVSVKTVVNTHIGTTGSYRVYQDDTRNLPSCYASDTKHEYLFNAYSGFPIPCRPLACKKQTAAEQMAISMTEEIGAYIFRAEFTALDLPVETQCTLCTCYLKSVAQLKTSRETLQHNLDEAQRKFLEFQKETQGEILEEKIAKERMRSEMGDLQIELEFLKAQLTLYQSQSNVSLSTNNKRLERSSREFKNSSCQVELEKNSRIERDCQ
ncbi:hypothetical protein EV359DRAFT_69254, partial [Lentinula novae-zelandiae]